MPPDEIDSASAESSTATEGSSQQEQQPDVKQGAQSSSAPGKDGSAASSPATAAQPTSALDAMKQAQAILKTANAARTAQPDEAGESPTQQASGKDDAAKQGEGDGAGKEEASAEGKDKPNPKTEARFRELTTKLKEAEPKVRHWDALQAFVADSGYDDPAEFAEGLKVLRMAKLEPHKAIPVLEQTLETLRRRVGEAGDLPADIQDRLDKGLIDEGTARELAAARGRNQFLDQREETARRQDELRKARANEQARVDSIASEITRAEAEWQKTDPDYGKLQPLVQDKVLALLTQRAAEIRTPADAQTLFKDAIAEVRKAAGALRGQVREVRPIGNDGGSGKGAMPEPKTSLEAMQLALRAHRAGA